MNIAKYLVVTALLFLGMIHASSAQNILSAEQKEKVAENVSNFLYELNLSERDKVACREILGDFFTGLVALRATNFSDDTNMEILKALIKGRDSRVKSVLSTDQYKVYKARAKERRANLREFMKQG